MAYYYDPDDEFDALSEMFQIFAIADPKKKFNRQQYIRRFKSFSSNIERFNFVYEDLKNKEYPLMPDDNGDYKNDQTAERFRKDGSKHFESGDYLKALQDYTRSIAKAETNVAMAKAYANRSACLFKLGMYKDCRTDINRALENFNSDNKLKRKLITRRENAEKLLTSTENYFQDIPTIPETEKNSCFDNASNCIKIEEKNNCDIAVATRSIEIGEVICVEKPLVSILTETDRLIHCHECLELCYNLIPCGKCTQALFCNELCKDKAQNTYHKHECAVLRELRETSNIKLEVVVRIALLARRDEDYLNKFEFLESRHTSKLCECVKYHQNWGNLLLDMCLLTRIFHLLKTKTDFFGNQQVEDNFKETVLEYLDIVSSDSLKIHEYAKQKDSYERNHFAYGIYSFAPFLNKSYYDPNVERTFYGSTIVLRALTTIQKGQQCFFNDDYYQFTYPNTTRQVSIMKYYLQFHHRSSQSEEVWESDFVKNKLLGADVDFAKQLLPKLMAQFKSSEMFYSFSKPTTIKEMIGHCYDTLGNKRRV